jgi:molybdopterin-guanine dinucleotide biosynthesis protein A
VQKDKTRENEILIFSFPLSKEKKILQLNVQFSSRRGAVIYASGMENKTIARQFEPEEEGTLLEYVLDSVWTVADELFIVFSQEPSLPLIEAISPFGVKVLTVGKKQSPILAVSDAFRTSKSECSILVTERIPFLKPNVALALFEASYGNDAAIPRWKNGALEPMLTVYKRNAFTRVVGSQKDKFGNNLYNDLSTLANQLFDVRFLSIENELRDLDPELDSFFQVKDERSLREARQKVSARGLKKAVIKKTAR